MKKQIIAMSALLLTLPLASCKSKEEKAYARFKNVVNNEINYDGSYVQETNVNVKQDIHIFENDKELSKEVIDGLGLSPMNLNMELKFKNIFDKENNSLAKYTSKNSDSLTLKEYYYTENNVEYKCYEKKEFDFDKFDWIYIKARESLDSGHINSISKLNAVSELEVVNELKSFDELLAKFATKVSTIKGAEDYDFSTFKIENTKVDKKYQTILTAPVKFSIMGLDIDVNAKGVLTYNKENIETFVIEANGTLTQVLSKDIEGVSKEYKAISNVNLNLALSLNKDDVVIEQDATINEYKTINANEASKEDIKANSILGSSNFIEGDNGFELPTKVSELKNCDVKIYLDKKHAKEVSLKDLNKKSYKQTYYLDILPKEGFALLIETINDPTPDFPSNVINVKEIDLKTTSKYNYLENVDIQGGFFPCPHNGKPWTYVLLNNEFVKDRTALTLESGKVYNVEYRFKELKK